MSHVIKTCPRSWAPFELRVFPTRYGYQCGCVYPRVMAFSTIPFSWQYQRHSSGEIKSKTCQRWDTYRFCLGKVLPQFSTLVKVTKSYRVTGKGGEENVETLGLMANWALHLSQAKAARWTIIRCLWFLRVSRWPKPLKRFHCTRTEKLLCFFF